MAVEQAGPRRRPCETLPRRTAGSRWRQSVDRVLRAKSVERRQAELGHVAEPDAVVGHEAARRYRGRCANTDGRRQSHPSATDQLGGIDAGSGFGGFSGFGGGALPSGSSLVDAGSRAGDARGLDPAGLAAPVLDVRALAIAAHRHELLVGSIDVMTLTSSAGTSRITCAS